MTDSITRTGLGSAVEHVSNAPQTSRPDSFSTKTTEKQAAPEEKYAIKDAVKDYNDRNFFTKSLDKIADYFNWNDWRSKSSKTLRKAADEEINKAIDLAFSHCSNNGYVQADQIPNYVPKIKNALSHKGFFREDNIEQNIHDKALCDHLRDYFIHITLAQYGINAKDNNKNAINTIKNAATSAQESENFVREQFYIHSDKHPNDNQIATYFQLKGVALNLFKIYLKSLAPQGD